MGDDHSEFAPKKYRHLEKKRPWTWTRIDSRRDPDRWGGSIYNVESEHMSGLVHPRNAQRRWTPP